LETLATLAISDSITSDKIFCKFLSANDTGETGGHQDGIYIPKNSISLIFEEPGIKGQNKEIINEIIWQNDFKTPAAFKYYGQRTRNEYRITRFGRGFPFLQPEYTGALVIILKQRDTSYKAYVLNLEDDINAFLNHFGLSPAETNRLIEQKTISLETREETAINDFIKTLTVDFPSSEEMSFTAQSIQNAVYNHNEYVQTNPDKKLLDWTAVEYNLFRAVEYARYGETITKGFKNVESFIEMANKVLNRRKSRAGKSLEHHLTTLFNGNNLQFTAQAVTEGNKRPDFIFPSEKAYHDMTFSTDKLISLAAKTTCKDRWRQVLNEADRLRSKTKFLCTLQQGISSPQLKEMKAENVVLVVPTEYILKYPQQYQSEIWSVKKFIDYVKEIES
jgi:type II restriction enzyme